MSGRQLLLHSSSRLHGFELLEHARHEIENFFNRNHVRTILFIPFALRNYDEYTKTISEPLENWGYKVEGLHTKPDEIEAINSAEAIFVGGGNTFVLLKTLYEKNLIEPIRERVLNQRIPYMGASAGTNVAARSIHTTNDMPVVYPPTFDALNLVPFNINPHYIEADSDSTHKGETRDQRLLEFVEYNRKPVIGLKEGTCLFINDENITLLGKFNAKIFYKDGTFEQYPPETDLSFLFEQCD